MSNAGDKVLEWMRRQEREVLAQGRVAPPAILGEGRPYSAPATGSPNRTLAEGLLHTMEHSAGEYARFLGTELRDFLQVLMGLLRRAIAVGTDRQLESAIAMLEAASHVLAADFERRAQPSSAVARRPGAQDPQAELLARASVLALELDAADLPDNLLEEIEARLVHLEHLLRHGERPSILTAREGLQNVMLEMLSTRKDGLRD